MVAHVAGFVAICQAAGAGDAVHQQVAGALRQRVVSGLASRVTVRHARLPPPAGAWGVAIEAREAALWEGAVLDQSATALAAS